MEDEMDLSSRCTQDLVDLMVSARLVVTENNSIFSGMFRSQFGRLFCDRGAAIEDCLTAYDDNAHLLGDVLVRVGDEIAVRLGLDDESQQQEQQKWKKEST